MKKTYYHGFSRAKLETPVPESGKGEPSSSLDYNDYLRFLELSRGVIRLDRAIYDEHTTRVLSELAYLRQRGIKDITLNITSPGGGAYHSFALYDALMEARKDGCKVTAVVEGIAASAAAMIVLQAADHRLARGNARFLIHEARRWVFLAVERTSDLEDEFGEMKKVEQRIIEVLAKRSGRHEAEVKKFIQRKEVWMSAKEAKEWGLIDAII